MTDLIREHLSRCVEVYGQPISDELHRAPTREAYEQMRADLMLAIGMLSALATAPASADSKRSVA